MLLCAYARTISEAPTSKTFYRTCKCIRTERVYLTCPGPWVNDTDYAFSEVMYAISRFCHQQSCCVSPSTKSLVEAGAQHVIIQLPGMDTCPPIWIGAFTTVTNPSFALLRPSPAEAAASVATHGHVPPRAQAYFCALSLSAKSRT